MDSTNVIEQGRIRSKVVAGALNIPSSDGKMTLSEYAHMINELPRGTW